MSQRLSDGYATVVEVDGSPDGRVVRQRGSHHQRDVGAGDLAFALSTSCSTVDQSNLAS